MEKNLQELAEKLGIYTTFSDSGMQKSTYEADENVIKFLAWELGYKTASHEDVIDSLKKHQNRRWQYTLENIYVVKEGEVCFEAVVPADENNFKVLCQGEDVVYSITDNGERNFIGHQEYKKIIFNIHKKFAPNYYTLDLQYNDKNYCSLLAICPHGCYEQDALKNSKIWGFALQLYSLKSKRNWGVGDFTDLKEFIKICGQKGAGIIGINPLNTLFHNNPEDASPYCSISRLFLNPIYIDVERVDGFKEDIVPNLRQEICSIKMQELINYTQVYNLKIKALQTIFEQKSSDKKFISKLNKFSADMGSQLTKLALFQSINNKYATKKADFWKKWDKGLQDINSKETKQYLEKNKQDVEFFKFLQMLAYQQLQEAYQEVENQNMSVGLYRDLAVGVGHNSAEVWGNKDIFIQEAGIGAPPDAFFPGGQKWGLAAFNPCKLKDLRYEPFIEILRANMRFAGALRMDHVMSLMRLYIIPDDKKSGTYLSYNFSDMLGIVALESHLNKCAIVGESIGNVPDGFLDKLSENNIYSLSVLWAQRWSEGWGDFKYPHEYPVNSFVSVGTHDMAPLRCWWFGKDLQTSRRVGILKTDESMHQQFCKREADRKMLLKVLDANDAWSFDKRRLSDYLYGENFPEGMEEAVHRLVSRSASKVFLTDLLDVFQVEKMQNLPGTNKDKYPNWRLRVPVDLEDYLTNEAFNRNVNAIKESR